MMEGHFVENIFFATFSQNITRNVIIELSIFHPSSSTSLEMLQRKVSNGQVVQTTWPTEVLSP